MLYIPTRITLNTSDVIDPVLESYLSIVMEEDERSSDDNYPQDNPDNNDNSSKGNTNDKPKEESNTNNNQNKENNTGRDKGFFEKLLDTIKEFFSKILKFFRKTPEDIEEVKDKLPENIVLKINNEETGKKTVGYLILLTDNYNKLDEYVGNVQRMSNLCNRIKSTTENDDLAGLHDEYKELSDRHKEFQEFFNTEIVDKVQSDKEYSFPSNKVSNNLDSITKKNTQAIQGNAEVDHSQSLSNEEEMTDRDKLLVDIVKLYKAANTFVFALSEQILSILGRASNGGKKKVKGLSDEDKFLLKEGKVDGNVDGYNTVVVQNNKFPYAKQNSAKEMQEKFGIRIIVVDRNIFNKLKSKTKLFAMKHEVGHIKQYEKNEDKGRPLEIQEGEADVYAVQVLGWNKKKLQAAYDDIIRVSGDPAVNDNPEAVKAQFVTRMKYVTQKLGI